MGQKHDLQPGACDWHQRVGTVSWDSNYLQIDDVRVELNLGHKLVSAGEPVSEVLC